MKRKLAPPLLCISTLVLFAVNCGTLDMHVEYPGSTKTGQSASSMKLTAAASPAVNSPGATGSQPTAISSLPTAAASINIQATLKTILDVGGEQVLWSPDGKWLIIGERQIHFYDAQSLKEVRALPFDTEYGGLAISPDSKTLAAIVVSRGVMLFDLASGSELRTLPRTEISTTAASNSYLAFSPDGATLAVILGDTVKLFNISSGEETRTIVAKDARAIAISPDGKNLYVGGGEAGISIWDMATGSQIRNYGDASREILRMTLSPDGSMLVSSGTFNNEAMILWEAATGRQLRTFSENKKEAIGLGVSCLAFSPDGRLLVSAGGDPTIKLWDVATGTLLQTLTGHTESAKSIAISPDGATLASGSGDGTTRLWTLSADTAQTTPAHASAANGSAAGPRPTAISLSSRAISPNNAAQIKKLSIMDVSESGNLVWSPDGKWLLIGGRKIHFYDVRTMKETNSLAYEMGGLAVSPDSKLLAAAGYPGVMLFDMATTSELLTLPRTSISTSALSNSFLAFSPDSAALAVIIGDVVKLFNVSSGNETGTIVAKDAMNITFSPDGKSLFVSGFGFGNNITVLDVATGGKIRDFGNTASDVYRMILSPDGSMLASSGTSDGTTTLWDAATGRQLRTLTGHTQGVSCLAFSPDGKILASASEDVTIKLWNTVTGDLLNTLVGHSEPATSIAFSPDGSTLASSNYSDGVYLWGLPG